MDTSAVGEGFKGARYKRGERDAAPAVFQAGPMMPVRRSRVKRVIPNPGLREQGRRAAESCRASLVSRSEFLGHDKVYRL